MSLCIVLQYYNQNAEFKLVSLFLQSHLGPLMSILKAHITHMEKDQLNTHQSELTSFFLTALDFRAQHCQVVAGPVLRLSLPLTSVGPARNPRWSRSTLTVLFCIALLFIGYCLKSIVTGLAVQFVLKWVGCSSFKRSYSSTPEDTIHNTTAKTRCHSGVLSLSIRAAMFFPLLTG